MYRIVVAAIALVGMLVVTPAEAVFNNNQKVIAVFSEQGDKAESSGFSVGLRNVDHSDFYFQAGLSYQRITLTPPPADYNDGRITPVFLYGRLGMNGWLSPYFQAGFDLNSSLMHWLDTNNNICCNAMARAGLELKLHENVRFEFYGSWYNLHYKGRYEPLTPIDYDKNGHEKRFSRTTLGAQLALVF